MAWFWGCRFCVAGGVGCSGVWTRKGGPAALVAPRAVDHGRFVPMAVVDGSGRDPAFEARIDEYYADLIVAALEAADWSLSPGELASLLVVHQGKVVELLERDPRAVPSARPDRHGFVRWSTAEGWAVAARRARDRAADRSVLRPPGLDRATPVMDRNAGRIARCLHAAGMPLSRGVLADRLGLKRSAVAVVFRSAHGRHRSLFVRAGRSSHGANLYGLSPAAAAALDAGERLLVDG